MAGSTVSTSCTGSASATTNSTASTDYISTPTDAIVAADCSPLAPSNFAAFSQAHPNALTVFSTPVSPAACCIPANLGTADAAVPLAAATTAAVTTVSAATANTSTTASASAADNSAAHCSASPAASYAATAFNARGTKQRS